MRRAERSGPRPAGAGRRAAHGRLRAGGCPCVGIASAVGAAWITRPVDPWVGMRSSDAVAVAGLGAGAATAAGAGEGFTTGGGTGAGGGVGLATTSGFGAGGGVGFATASGFGAVGGVGLATDGGRDDGAGSPAGPGRGPP